MLPRRSDTLSAKIAKLMVFKLVNATAKTWRRLKGENQLPKVIKGIIPKRHRGHRNAGSLHRLINLVTQNTA